MKSRDQIIRKNIQAIGEDSFPEDEVIWNIGEIIHKGNYSSVEAIPYPSTVGYDKFKFILVFEDEQKYHIAGCYCWDNKSWSLLFINPETKDLWENLF
jgi:hypothetical protein